MKPGTPWTGTAVVESGNSFPSSEEVARLYDQLADSFRSDDSEAAKLIYRELLRLGRPRSEILGEAARAAVAHVPQPLPPGSLAESVDPTDVEPTASTAMVHSQNPPSVLTRVTGSNAEHDPERPREAHRVQREYRQRFRFAGLNVRTLFWLALAACFTGLAASAGTAVFTNHLLISGDATSSVRTVTPEATERSAKERKTPSIETPVRTQTEPARSPEPINTAQSLNAQDLAAVRARGDALLSMGDVTSSRLFYERAVVAGDAQAAIRLGATYDPVFLSQAHLQNVHSNLAIALDWYRRARDLGAVEAESLLRSIESKSE